MCDGIVIDGHVMRDFNKEYPEKTGNVYSLVSWIIANCGIAISDPIKTHWESNCGSSAKNPSFWEWYFRELHINHTIHFIPIKRFPGNIWRVLVARYRIPRDLFVRAVIECADSTSEPRYILAEDMLLHDPVAKTTHPNTQQDIRENRTGSLCQHLERNLSIILGTTNHCKEYFEIDQEDCKTKSLHCNNPCPRVCRN